MQRKNPVRARFRKNTAVNDSLRAPRALLSRLKQNKRVPFRLALFFLRKRVQNPAKSRADSHMSVVTAGVHKAFSV